MQAFRYANKILPTSTMRQLYFTHIYPHLIGNITIWGSANASTTYLQPLIRTQKRIIRLIKNLPPRSHTKPIMAHLKILSIPSLYILRTSIEMHPFVYPTQPKNRPTHNHIYTPASHIHEYPTRFSNSGHQFIPAHTHPSTKPTHDMNYFTRQYSTVWNSLPADIRTEPNLTTFKKLLAPYLLQKQTG